MLSGDILMYVFDYCETRDDYSAWSLLCKHANALMLHTWPRGPIDIPMRELMKRGREWFDSFDSTQLYTYAQSINYLRIMDGSGVLRYST